MAAEARDPTRESPASARAAGASAMDQVTRGQLTADRRDAVRRAALAALPRFYSPWAHLAATTGIGVAVLVVSVVFLRDVRALEWLVVPAVFLAANAFEWRVHKHVLHRRRWPVEIIYDQHTPMHHMVYVEEDMELREPRELGLVLIPAAGVLGVVAVSAPVAYLVSYLLGANAGWLFLLTASTYMVGYELSHLAYHLPASSLVGRSALVKRLRAHHARHHDPRLMQRYNFNVTIPLFDWLMGTTAPRED